MLRSVGQMVKSDFDYCFILVKFTVLNEAYIGFIFDFFVIPGPP